jgi:hypothetical protein
MRSAIAASVIFDHHTRADRPQAGDHYNTIPGIGKMYRASQDTLGWAPYQGSSPLTIPNGTALAGGRHVRRTPTSGYQYGKGYWYFDYLDQAGSFYEKTYVFEMMLSAYYRAPYAFTRWDGLDGRWRFTNFANLFPEGMRRTMGLMMTEDWETLAARVATKNGMPIVEPPDANDNVYPAKPLGWVSFVPQQGPEVCWPMAGNYVCRDPMSQEVLPGAPQESVAIDPQLGFETQKFMAFWAYVYQPSSQVMDFTDMMRIWKTGQDVDPAFATKLVEWLDPDSGLRYYAKRYGDEQIFDRVYDKGIAAKMIQWANKLSALAYELDATTPYDPVMGRANIVVDEFGKPKVIVDKVTVPSDSAI